MHNSIPMQNSRDISRQRQMGIGDLLLENRIIFLDGAVHDGSANAIVMKLLYLQHEARKQDIHLYVNSPGGSVTAAMAIYDTMQYIDCDVATYCVGLAASAGALLVAGGTAEKRYALPHSKMMIHQPWGGVGGQVSDLEILAKHTGQSIEKIAIDTDRDNHMTAQEAKDYGLVDEILIREDDKKSDEKSDEKTEDKSDS